MKSTSCLNEAAEAACSTGSGESTMTIVNGEVVVKDGEHTGACSGRMLESGKIANGYLSS